MDRNRSPSWLYVGVFLRELRWLRVETKGRPATWLAEAYGWWGVEVGKSGHAGF